MLSTVIYGCYSIDVLLVNGLTLCYSWPPVLRIRDEVLANCSANTWLILLLSTLYIYMSCHPVSVYL